MEGAESDNHNLIDPEQVPLFDAFDELSRLGIDIKIPQLVVVGDQSSGKSSTLEALVRFSFPVDGKFCTRFPIRLILRRSRDSRPTTEVTIESAQGRSEQEKQAFAEAFEGCNNDLKACIQKSSKIFGLESPLKVSGTKRMKKEKKDRSNPSSHTSPVLSFDFNHAGSAQAPGDPNSSSRIPKPVTGAAADVLRVEKIGPDYGHVSLLDLPGLIQAETQEQSRETIEIIRSMVRGYVSSKRNIILLVVNAKTSLSNHYSLSLIQELKEDDKTLSTRVIPVVTNPDNAGDLRAECLDLLLNRLGSDSFSHPWHVVRNQPQSRRSEGLDQRDNEEREFLNSDELFEGITGIPQDRKGISSLRSTVRQALQALTLNELPSLIAEVQDHIDQINCVLKELGPSRSEPYEYTQYLEDIALVHSRLIEAACQGDYDSKACVSNSEIGHLQHDCKACSFFHAYGADDPHGQSKRLRANIRLLNQMFATAMREAGRTDKIVYRSNTLVNKHQESPALLVEQNCEKLLPSWRVLKEYYRQDAPNEYSRATYEESLAQSLLGWRGQEPPGEPSAIMYGAFFEYQSKNWRSLAVGHHEAVWKVVREFTDEALAASCLDERVRSALQDRIISPELDRLKQASAETLQSLLACRGRGKTGFYDSFMNLFEQQHHNTVWLISELEALDKKVDTARTEMKKDPDPKHQERFVLHMKDLLRATMTAVLQYENCLPAGLGLQNLITDQLVSMIERVFLAENKAETDGSESQKIGVEALLDSRRVLDHVEIFYKTVLQSFIGFVNALVIEGGIIDRLPGAIFGRIKSLIRDGSEEARREIKEIAGEDEGVAASRKEYQMHLRKLESVLQTLRKRRKD